MSDQRRTTSRDSADALPPTEYLAMEVLAARYRLGDHVWTFPKKVALALYSLKRKGFVRMRPGVMPKTFIVSMTDHGRTEFLHNGYQPSAPDQPTENAPRSCTKCLDTGWRVLPTVAPTHAVPCDRCDHSMIDMEEALAIHFEVVAATATYQPIGGRDE